MKHTCLLIAVLSLVTALLRFLPFLLFRSRTVPGWLERFGKLLPSAVMGMLVVYCLRDMSFAAAGQWIPAVAAGAVTAGSYVLRRNTLISILLGTVCYMLLVQLVFV